MPINSEQLLVHHSVGQRRVDRLIERNALACTGQMHSVSVCSRPLPALPMPIAPVHPAFLTPIPTAVTA